MFRTWNTISTRFNFSGFRQSNSAASNRLRNFFFSFYPSKHTCTSNSLTSCLNSFFFLPPLPPPPPFTPSFRHTWPFSVMKSEKPDRRWDNVFISPLPAPSYSFVRILTSLVARRLDLWNQTLLLFPSLPPPIFQRNVILNDCLFNFFFFRIQIPKRKLNISFKYLTIFFLLRGGGKRKERKEQKRWLIL